MSKVVEAEAAAARVFAAAEAREKLFATLEPELTRIDAEQARALADHEAALTAIFAEATLDDLLSAPTARELYRLAWNQERGTLAAPAFFSRATRDTYLQYYPAWSSVDGADDEPVLALPTLCLLKLDTPPFARPLRAMFDEATYARTLAMAERLLAVLMELDASRAELYLLLGDQQLQKLSLHDGVWHRRPVYDTSPPRSLGATTLADALEVLAQKLSVDLLGIFMKSLSSDES
jgi:hypothetical protein